MLGRHRTFSFSRVGQIASYIGRPLGATAVWSNLSGESPTAYRKEGAKGEDSLTLATYLMSSEAQSILAQELAWPSIQPGVEPPACSTLYNFV